LVEELSQDGFSVCANTVSRLLREELELGRRQASKSLPLGEHSRRDEQFQRIDELKRHFLQQGWPVVSIDTKKKEPLGEFFRPGRAWTDGRVRALDHDFARAGDGKAIPYGVYDLAANEGFVLLACGADTAELACDALHRWWCRLGRRRYEGAARLLVLADSGGSNGYRLPLFRYGLCGLARRLDLSIRVAHLPPYCSKYNPTDHRLFCHLARSIRGMLCRE
jgi:DDE family transposase